MLCKMKQFFPFFKKKVFQNNWDGLHAVLSYGPLVKMEK